MVTVVDDDVVTTTGIAFAAEACVQREPVSVLAKAVDLDGRIVAAASAVDLEAIDFGDTVTLSPFRSGLASIDPSWRGNEAGQRPVATVRVGRGGRWYEGESRVVEGASGSTSLRGAPPDFADAFEATVGTPNVDGERQVVIRRSRSIERRASIDLSSPPPQVAVDFASDDRRIELSVLSAPADLVAILVELRIPGARWIGVVPPTTTVVRIPASIGPLSDVAPVTLTLVASPDLSPEHYARRAVVGSDPRTFAPRGVPLTWSAWFIRGSRTTVGAGR
ncbi:MAG: hypothetical protein AAF602_04635 [Myxococcota bacterium]